MMYFAHVLSREAYQSYWMNHTTVPDEDLCGLHLRKDKNCDELCLCLHNVFMIIHLLSLSWSS